VSRDLGERGGGFPWFEDGEAGGLPDRAVLLGQDMAVAAGAEEPAVLADAELPPVLA